MKKIKQFYLLIGILILISCEKEYDFEKIIFTDIQPNKSLTTYGNYSLGLYENNIVTATSKAWINDSIFSFAISKTPLDLNKDGIEDFIIEIEHQLTDSSEYIFKDKFGIQLIPLNSNLISMTNKDLGYIKSYDFNQETDTTTFCRIRGYSDSATGAYIIKNDGDDSFQLLGDYYIAIKLLEDNIPYYGWIHIKVEFFKLILCDYAVSKEPNTLIKMGQTK